MVKLKFLGRGSAFNINEGNTSAYIKKNETLLLIDCGETVFKEIQKRNLLDGVKNVYVLITHFHSDHVGSLSSLIMYCYYVKKLKLKVMYPDKFRMSQLLSLNGANDAICNVVEVCDFWHINELQLHIYWTPITHCKEIKSFGYLIEDENNNYIYYSGDSNTVAMKSSPSIVEDNTILYQDTCLADYDGNVHLSLRKLCEAIPKEHRHKVYCMHIDNNELIEKAKLEEFNVVEVE